MHNSGHFGPPLPFWAPGPPALPGLPMASYATGCGVMVLLVLWQRRGRIKEVRSTQSNCRVSRVKHESATLKNYRLYL